jgi:redox-sensitive bicupin YhaK (pirin superfamily)
MEVIRSNERGFFDHGWLKTYHTFSFADYYNPQRMHFGMLRVVNDDIVEGNQGFGKHPHKDMEIISIPLYGSLAHEDSTGAKGVILSNEVQVMSAGTGVVHSEQNPSVERVNFLQIWIFPNKKNVTPRYGQKKFDEKDLTDQFRLLVSPDGREDSLWIHQNAFVSRIKSTTENELLYKPFETKNGVFLFVLEGKATLDSITLNRRDTLLANPDELVNIQPQPDSQFLFIEVPMA